ncbi:MAG: penicillin acylase family protein, partial [Pseudomonadota bacterium]
MRSVLRWLIRIATATVALAALVALLALWIAGRSLPDYEADWSVDGIEAPVEIVRSSANVPHIFGDSDEDVFFGLGFAHAQDRLWQMLMIRQTAQGRLSEMFGTRTVGIDELLRRLDIYGHATASVEALDPRTMAALEAYARGVNAHIQLVSEEALGRGAPELFLFTPEVAPWRPADSVAVSLMMALQLAIHHEEEVLRARTDLMLDDPARLADILPDAPGGGITALPDFASLFDVPPPRYAADTTGP